MLPVVTLDKTNMNLVITLPLPTGSILGGASASVPLNGLQGATFGFDSITGGTGLVLTIPLSAVVHGANFVQSGVLPNGEPLPGVPDGEMPELAVQLTSGVNATIYMSPNIVGVYVPTSFNPYINLTLPIRHALKICLNDMSD
jgi:hypothetical protein